MDLTVLLAAVPYRQVEQQEGQSLRAGGHRMTAEHPGRVTPALRDHAPVGVARAGIGVQEGIEPLEPHDQRPDRVDGLHRGGPVAGGLARHLPDQLARSAQREHHLVAVAGHPDDLDPARHQDEHVGGRIAFDAHRRAGREHAGPAESRQAGLFRVAKKIPEARHFL